MWLSFGFDGFQVFIAGNQIRGISSALDELTITFIDGSTKTWDGVYPGVAWVDTPAVTGPDDKLAYDLDGEEFANGRLARITPGETGYPGVKYVEDEAQAAS